MTAPVIAGHFGEFGGRFVPEALMHALDQLESAYLAAKENPDFINELAVLQKNYTGRPTPITDVKRFGELAGGARILLKREDLNHTG